MKRHTFRNSTHTHRAEGWWMLFLFKQSPLFWRPCPPPPTPPYPHLLLVLLLSLHLSTSLGLHIDWLLVFERRSFPSWPSHLSGSLPFTADWKQEVSRGKVFADGLDSWNECLRLSSESPPWRFLCQDIYSLTAWKTAEKCFILYLTRWNPLRSGSLLARQWRLRGCGGLDPAGFGQWESGQMPIVSGSTCI